MNWLNTVGVMKVIPFLSKSLFIVTIILLGYYILEMINDRYKERKIKGLVKRNDKITNMKNMKHIVRYYKNLEIVLVEKNKEGLLSIIFYSSIGAMFLSTLGFLLVNQVLLAIVAPILLLFIFNKIAVELTTNIIEAIEEQLPFAIDNIIRISTKYGDIKSIIYEASRACEQPMRGILEDMSREMISSYPEEVLLSYAKKYDNVWFYSFIFTIVSYLEDASKDETMKNLKELRDILEKENTLKKASITDKKYSVAINYMLVLSSIVGFFINLGLNPVAKTFFFSTFIGLLCFLFGCVCIIGTIFINIKMSKNKKGE